MTLEKIILSGLLGLMLSCGSAEETGSKTGCTSNSECKGGRVCYQSKCVEQGEVPEGEDDSYPEGKIMFENSSPEGPNKTTIYLMVPDGSKQKKIVERRSPDGMSLSPDGTEIAYGSGGEYSENGESTIREPGIYILALNGNSERKIGERDDRDPDWSPDGTQIAFVADFDDIYVMNADGTNRRNLTNSENTEESDPDWSPDGTKIAFVADFDDIYVMNADGSEQRTIENGMIASYMPVWSPDGSRIAFMGHKDLYGESNRPYIMNADGSNPQPLQFESVRPIWSPDGSKLAVSAAGSNGNSSVYVVDVDGSNPQELTQLHGWEFPLDWSPR